MYWFVSLNYEYFNDSLVLQLHFERLLTYGSWNKRADADTVGNIIAACAIARASVCNFPPKIEVTWVLLFAIFDIAICSIIWLLHARNLNPEKKNFGCVSKCLCTRYIVTEQPKNRESSLVPTPFYAQGEMIDRISEQQFEMAAAHVQTGEQNIRREAEYSSRVSLSLFLNTVEPRLIIAQIPR